MYDDTQSAYVVRSDGSTQLSSLPTIIDEDRKSSKKRLKKAVRKFADLQELFYADDRYSLLLVFQGMDAAGKDSTIKNVTSGVNPAGFQVFSFKRPTYKEVDHTWLRRYWQALPQRGRIGIFNRSHYEEVLVVRVHPEIVQDRKLPEKETDASFWQHRMADIRNFEHHLERNGTQIVKFFLNVSKDEQKRRFMSRLTDPEKHWKYSNADINERGYWDDYAAAFESMLQDTSTPQAPWYAIPADDKPAMRATVAEIVVHHLDQLPLRYPDAQEGIAAAKRRLDNE